MSTLDLLINGGGVAGLAAAFWLRRAGHEVTVVERAPAQPAGGQTVDLRGAGRTVIERMGVLPALLARTVEQRGIAWVDDRGRRRAEMPVEAFGGNGIISEQEILRGDLAAGLLEALPAGVEVRYGDTVTGIAQDADGISVSFERAPSRRYDVVIGADGSHSVVRRLAIAPESECFHPLGLAHAWFTVPAEVELGDWYLLHNAPGGRVASIRPGRLTGEQKASLSVRTKVPLARDRETQLAFFTTAFAGVGWEAGRLVEAAQHSPDFYAESMGQIRLDRWSADRVVLLGDAGYCPTPLTGLGTSLALVGAYVLAGELSAAASDPTPEALRAALTRYELIMRPYVTTGQELPPGGVGGYAPTSRFRIAATATSMRWSQRWPMRLLMEQIFAKADAVDLPDYQSRGVPTH